MINFYYFILTILRIIKYLISDTKRYSNILSIIFYCKPKSIAEIGVYRGVRSREMIQAAKIFNKNIEYFGFDLFEMINKKIQKKELSKIPYSRKNIQKNLSKHARVKLFKGYTVKTLDKLKNKKVDLIFIDGGHRLSTIKNDWIKSKKFQKKNTIIIFDDYYLNNKKIIKNFGCNQVVNKISDKNYLKKFCIFTDKFIHLGQRLDIKMILLKKLDD
tara:strand:+ start:1880 stop:2527 length:648 start_codon:yes stop_codon:yes gene_type:complete